MGLVDTMSTMREKLNLSYVICTTVRSGSWMLCSGLSQTGIAGQPVEFFGQTLWEELMNNRSLLKLNDIQDFMGRVMEVSTTPNGVFGTKLPANHAGMFLRRVADDLGRPISSLREALESEFPNLEYILLTRENKVAQAISLYRAVMGGEWLRTEANAGRKAAHVNYDHFGIQRCYEDVIASDAYWEAFFTHHSLDVFRLTYEELLSDYPGTMRRLLKFLGLPWHIDIPQPKTLKLADEQSLAWEQEFNKNGRVPAKELRLRPETFWAPF